MSVRLSGKQAEIVNQFKEGYPRMSDSEMLGMALEYYLGAIHEQGMDVRTWMPVQIGQVSQKEKPRSVTMA